MSNAKYRVKQDCVVEIRKSDPTSTIELKEGQIVTMLQCGPIDRHPDARMGDQVVRLDNGMEVYIEGNVLELIEGTEGAKVD